MKKTVWHLCSNRWNSAITEYALRSAQALKARGWNSILSALPGSHCERRAKDYGVDGPSFRFRWQDFFALKKAAAHIRPDIIITYGGPETFFARFLGAPVVRFRGQDSDLVKDLSTFELTLNVGFCRALLTPAKIVKDRFQAVLPQKKIEAIMLGLDAHIFHAKEKSVRRPHLLIVGRLDPIKGHAAFLEMYSQFLSSRTHAAVKPLLQIIGQASNVKPEELHARAKSLGLKKGEDYEIIDERVPDLPERMREATLGLIPSLGSEVIGRVTEEFLLSGTPVLITRVGSLHECLIDPSMGAFLTNENLSLWFEKAFYETEDERKKRSLLAAEAFSLEAMGTQLSDFLGGLLDTHK